MSVYYVIEFITLSDIQFPYGLPDDVLVTIDGLDCGTWAFKLLIF